MDGGQRGHGIGRNGPHCFSMSSGRRLSGHHRGLALSSSGANQSVSGSSGYMSQMSPSRSISRIGCMRSSFRRCLRSPARQQVGVSVGPGYAVTEANGEDLETRVLVVAVIELGGRAVPAERRMPTPTPPTPRLPRQLVPTRPGRQSTQLGHCRGPATTPTLGCFPSWDRPRPGDERVDAEESHQVLPMVAGLSLTSTSLTGSTTVSKCARRGRRLASKSNNFIRDRTNPRASPNSPNSPTTRPAPSATRHTPSRFRITTRSSTLTGDDPPQAGHSGPPSPQPTP